MTKQPEITDPYTDQPLPDAHAPITDAPVETGYDRTSPNPARGGPTAPLYFVAGPDGIVAAFTTPAIEGDDTPDVHRRALNAMYARLTREGKHVPRKRKRP